MTASDLSRIVFSVNLSIIDSGTGTSLGYGPNSCGLTVSNVDKRAVD